MGDMSTITLTESVKSPTKSKNGRWLVTCAVPGQGSSGYYSEELLKRDGPAALPPGSQSFIDHGPGRNPRDLIGVFEDGGYWCEETQTLKAELTVFSHWESFVSEIAPFVGMSLYMSGSVDEDGVVTELTPSPLNGCDLVARPGLAGSGLDERVVESLLSEARTNATAEEDEHMEELSDKLDALTEVLTQYIASQEKAKEDDAPTPEDLVAEAVEKFDAAVREIAEANLLPSQVTDLQERAKRGEDISAAIESAKAVTVELREQIKAESQAQDGVGRVIGGTQVESAVSLGAVFG